jgi:hypothetical protein
VRFYVRKISVKGEVAAICHDGLENVGVLALGRNTVRRQIPDFVEDTKTVTVDINLALQTWPCRIETKQKEVDAH